MSGKTVAILHYEDIRSPPRGYLVSLMRQLWERQGVKVIDLFGIRKFVPADIIFVHVDLSVVPPGYQRFAEKYPQSINLQATDIRKSTYSPHLLSKVDRYAGAVIVKSNLNCAGIPERLARQFRLVRRVARKLPPKFLPGTHSVIKDKSDYRIFNTLAEVPAMFFDDGFVIQKFLPERRDDEYVLREYYFLNDVEFQSVEVGPDPIITTGSRYICADPEPAPVELRQLRKKLHLDFGKIDFVLVDGKPIIFDANKTVGTRRNPTAITWEIARNMAAGLMHFTANESFMA